MTEREAFEKWLKDERPFSSIERGVGADGEPNCGDYERWPIEMAWQGWQAARAQPAGVPEGFPDHAEIYVGDGRFAICDWADWPLVKAYNWRLTTKNKNGCLYAQAWDRKDKSTRLRITMHGLIYVSTGLVDHINGDGLDNRRSNLRSATKQQNTFNQKARGGTSKYKGVCREEKSNSWRAYITHNGRRISLGRHQTEEDAATAYNLAARKLFGDFARANDV